MAHRQIHILSGTTKLPNVLPVHHAAANVTAILSTGAVYFPPLYEQHGSPADRPPSSQRPSPAAKHSPTGGRSNSRDAVTAGQEGSVKGPPYISHPRPDSALGRIVIDEIFFRKHGVVFFFCFWLNFSNSYEVFGVPI